MIKIKGEMVGRIDKYKVEALWESEEKSGELEDANWRISSINHHP
jgi:hypothetical protein